MCLIYNSEETEKLKQKCKKNKKTFIICYKMVRWNSILSHIQSWLFYHVWNGGWNHAHEKPYKREELKNDEHIECGIHVYTTKKFAIRMKRGYSNFDGYTILPVKCYIKDLIGIDYRQDVKNAVFTKVWVDKKEIDKIRRKYVKNN